MKMNELSKNRRRSGNFALLWVDGKNSKKRCENGLK